jgi:hypothetical protein
VRILIKKGATTVSKSGPKVKVSGEEYKALSDALMSYVAIAQSNGDYEKKNSYMESLLKVLCKSSKKDYLVKVYRHVWQKIEQDNYLDLELTKEMQQECCHSFWMTYANLNDWFDAWEKFVVEKGLQPAMVMGVLSFLKCNGGG